MEIEDHERRRHDRIPAHLPVRISTIDPESDPFTGKPFFRSSQEWSGNVSRGGLFVMTHEPILPGQRVLVQLGLPGGESVEAVGRVAWARRVVSAEGADPESGVGLQLVGATGEQLQMLESYLRARYDGQIAA